MPNVTESKFYPDPEYDDLMWVEFNGSDWTNYNQLLDELEVELQKPGPHLCVIFLPAMDLPKGSPMPHIQRFIRMVERNERFDLLIPVVPPWMQMAKAFVNITLRLTRMQQQVIIAGAKDEALQHYQAYHDQNPRS